MSIESSADLDGMKEAARVTRLTLDALEQHARIGVTTGELDAIAAAIYAEHGAQSAPTLTYGFPGHVLISINDEVVHGIPGPRRIEDGDVVSLDVTVEKDGYIADAARTVIAGNGSAKARRLVRCAESAFKAALSVARAGVRVNEIGRAVQSEVRRRGFTVIRGLTGHGVGRAIHEEPSVANEYDPFQLDVLTEGLVITIEPMISAGSARTYQDEDGWTIRTIDGSLASHYEHTLIVTKGRPHVLTAA
jgi:methionyl aminopeptidase